MKKEFIPYEQALALEELGFDEDCFSDYFSFNNVNQTLEDDIQLILNQESIDDYCEENNLYPFHICSAPLYQQAFRWFREKYNLIGNPNHYGGLKHPNMACNYKISGHTSTGQRILGQVYDNYEEAELECLKKLIEIVKEKK